MNSAVLPAWVSITVAILLIAGSGFALIGAAGLLRLPDFQSRLHAPTLGNSFGLGCVLCASMLVAGALGERLVLQEILIAVLVIMTSPVSTLLLMQASLHRNHDRLEENSANSTKNDS